MDYDNASLICQEFGYETNTGKIRDLFPEPLPIVRDNLPQRPPFVTIMGHVDHGKTTILDYLRKSSIVAGEHGGITQHIGAFSVPVSGGSKRITFLDTPGHAAFLKMRQRGANVTDIVVLVVAADDSVMPQTIEAIKHARNAKVPIIVAVNKIDKPNVDVDRVYQDLAKNDVVVEEYGGDTQAILVSGLTGKGIDELEEAILTLSEVLDFRSPVDGRCEGWVVESELAKGRGAVATLVVRRGTLTPGTPIVAGTAYGRVRTLRDESGKIVKAATPGTPVEVDGWKVLPEAGDEVLQADNEKHARSVADYRTEHEINQNLLSDLEGINERRQQDRANYNSAVEAAELTRTGRRKRGTVSQKDFLVDMSSDDGIKYRNFILKSDVMGSAEAIEDSIVDIGNDKAKVRLVRAESDIGPPTASDVLLAETSGSEIICFNVKPDREIKALAANKGVNILMHTIIYHLIEDVTARTAELLPPIITKKVVAEAEIRASFEITAKSGEATTVAGCRVTSGTAKRAQPLRVMRKNVELFSGTIDTMKQYKRDVTEVQNGSECGLSFNGYSEFREGDIVQFYEEIEQKAYL